MTTNREARGTEKTRLSGAIFISLIFFPLCVGASQATDVSLHYALRRGAAKAVEGQQNAFPLSRLAPQEPAFNARKIGKLCLFGSPQIAGRALNVGYFGTADIPDRVVVDTNENQHLDSADLTLPLKKISATGDVVALASEPFRVPLPRAPEASYYLRLGVERVTHWTLNGVETGWKGTAQSVGWASGVLNWNGRNVTVGVQDDDGNGRFDDPFRTNRQDAGDLMFFDWNGDGQFRGSREVLRSGRYLFADDQLCALTVATGGVRLTVEPVTTGTGKFQCDPSVREVHLVSQQGLLVAPLRDGAVELPNGQYSLLLWIARQTAANGDGWEMKAGNALPPQVTIGAAPAQIKLRAALSPVLSADRQDDGLRFTLAVGTAGGDTLLRLAPLTGPAPTPQLRLFDAAGRPLARIRLAPEGQATFGAFWHPPPDAPDLLRARLEFDHGPFDAVDSPDWEFAVPRAAIASSP